MNIHIAYTAVNDKGYTEAILLKVPNLCSDYFPTINSVVNSIIGLSTTNHPQHLAWKTIHSLLLKKDTVITLWGKVCSTDTQLQEGDRIEITPTLLIDPKAVRRQMAEKLPLPPKHLR